MIIHFAAKLAKCLVWSEKNLLPFSVLKFPKARCGGCFLYLMLDHLSVQTEDDPVWYQLDITIFPGTSEIF